MFRSRSKPYLLEPDPNARPHGTHISQVVAQEIQQTT